MPVRRVGFRRRTVAVVGLAAILLAAVASARYLLTREPGSHEVAQPPLSMKMRRLARIVDTADAALSPDGRFLAYVARKGGQCGLWIRQVSTGSDIQIVPPQEPTPTGVRFSPNGEYLYFLTQDPEAIIYRTLFQVPTLGVTPRKVLFDVDSGVTFSPDGRRMAFMRGLTEPKANCRAFESRQGRLTQKQAASTKPAVAIPIQQSLACESLVYTEVYITFPVLEQGSESPQPTLPQSSPARQEQEPLDDNRSDRGD